MDSEWKHKATEAYKRVDGCTQASIKWSRGAIDQRATIIIHPTLKRAQLAFRRGGKEDLQDDFRIDGIGDEAFLWPPKSPQGGDVQYSVPERPGGGLVGRLGDRCETVWARNRRRQKKLSRQTTV